MKFLCVKCDEQMMLDRTSVNETQGSLSAIFSCSNCGNQTAMLTNRSETQMVTSLGVKIGHAGDESSTGEQSKCPFSSMLNDNTAQNDEKTGVSWSKDADQRLARVPDMVRPMAKLGIEQYAAERGYDEITTAVLDEAKSQFGF